MNYELWIWLLERGFQSEYVEISKVSSLSYGCEAVFKTLALILNS